MTGNILMLSRLENQQTGIERSAFSLDEQLRQIVLLYEDEWNRKELCLELDLPAVTYVGNEELLFQVWQNLFGNAVKFSNPGGSVFLQLLPEEKKKQITVLLRDTGTGIAEKDLNRIFEKFYQANNPGTHPEMAWDWLLPNRSRNCTAGASQRLPPSKRARNSL